MIARDGGLPAGLSRTEWRGATGGLLLTAALVLVVMLSFDLSGIAMMGSAAFLLIYAAVNAGHLKVLKATGASAVLVWLSLLTCLAMLAVLYPAGAAPRACRARAHRCGVVRRRMGLPALDRTQAQRSGIAVSSSRPPEFIDLSERFARRCSIIWQRNMELCAGLPSLCVR